MILKLLEIAVDEKTTKRIATAVNLLMVNGKELTITQVVEAKETLETLEKENPQTPTA